MHKTPRPINAARYKRIIEITMHFPHALIKSNRIIDKTKAVKSEMSDIFQEDLRSLTN